MVPLLDLLVFKLGGRSDAEIKWMDALPLTGSMPIALANLQLAHLTIVETIASDCFAAIDFGKNNLFQVDCGQRKSMTLIAITGFTGVVRRVQWSLASGAASGTGLGSKLVVNPG